MADELAFQPFRTRNALAIALPLMAFLGLQFERPMLVALAAALLALMVVTFALGWYQCARIDVRRRVASGAFEDETVQVELLVANRGLLPLFLFELSDRFTPAEYSFKRVIAGDALPPLSVSLLSYHGHCVKRRGRYEVGPLRVRVIDPLGLFEHDRILPLRSEILVYPATIALDYVALDGTSPRQAARRVSERHSGSSPSFQGTREYRTGDSRRAIHWPSSARRGKLVVAEYDREVARHLAIFVDLDRRRRAGLGTRSIQEVSVKLAASLALHALAERSMVELVLNADKERLVRAGAGRSQLLRVLAALVDVKQDGHVPLTPCLDRHLPRMPPGSSVAIITSSAALADPGAAAALVSRCRGVRRGRRRRPLVVLLDHASFLQLSGTMTPQLANAAAQRAAELTAAGAAVYVVRADRPLALQFAHPWQPDAAEPAA